MSRPDKILGVPMQWVELFTKGAHPTDLDAHGNLGDLHVGATHYLDGHWIVHAYSTLSAIVQGSGATLAEAIDECVTRLRATRDLIDLVDRAIERQDEELAEMLHMDTPDMDEVTDAHDLDHAIEDSNADRNDEAFGGKAGA